MTGLGLELQLFLRNLSFCIPVCPWLAPCCVALNLVGHWALMLSKNLVNGQHCSLSTAAVFFLCEKPGKFFL